MNLTTKTDIIKSPAIRPLRYNLIFKAILPAFAGLHFFESIKEILKNNHQLKLTKMKKCILLLLGAFLFYFGTNAQTTIPGGYFNVDRTLTLANSPYVTSNQDVATGVTVTIEEGVEIRFNSDTYFQVFGTLNAKGVKFTANNGSTAKGYWRGLYVAYEGFSYFGNINLDSCTVEYAQNIWCRKGALTLRKTTIDNFSGNGVLLYAQGTFNITESTIKNCNAHPINLNGPGILTGSNSNILTGNTNDYIYFEFNDVSSGNFYTPKFDIPYRLTTFRVGTNATWNIEPGVEIKSFNSEITINGKIKALGTSDKPVVFDMHPGASDWRGINITNSAVDTACIFQHCIFKSAKNNNDAYVAMGINAASPSFENCKFTDNGRNLFVTGISNPTFTNCNFEPSTILSAESYNIGMDMNANIDFSSDSIKFNNNEIRAVRILPSTVINDGHLKKLSFKNLDNPTYCLYGQTIVHDTASLVIDPGVVIKCRQYDAYIMANGTLTGIGTEAEPIVYTHIADDSFGNPLDSENNGQAAISNSNSGRLMLYGTTTSQIKNWKIHYGGYNSGNWAVYVSKGNIVENCEIKNSHRGIYFYDNAQVLNNSFSNINSYPLGRKVNQGNPVLIGNTVSSVGTLGILIGEFANDSPTLKSFDFAGLTNVAYVVESNLAIAAGNVVTVDPGVVLKFQNNNSGFLTINGALKSIGTESNKIIFTSINDDSAGGDTNNNGTSTTPGASDWQGLDFTGTASDTENIMKNCEVRYSGYYYFYTSVRITDCRVVMDSTLVNFCYWGAVGIFGTANPEITNCQFYNLNNAPIYMDMFSNPTFSGNTVANLPRIGLRIRGGNIEGTIPVRNFAGYDNISYIIEEEMTVPNTKELIIPDGLSFKGNGLWRIRGKLNVQGTSVNPVVFSAQEDDLYGSPKDMQQNGNTTPGNGGNYFIFYDESDDASTIENALFRYSATIPIQTNNASPKILNTTFRNIAFEGVSLAGSSAPTINNCTFDNIAFPFRISLVTYPAETAGNAITGSTGRAIRVVNETLTQNATLVKREFAGIANIPYAFQNYTVGTAAILTIKPGVVCKFVQNGYMNVQNGLIAKGGGTTDSTIVFTADRDDFYGGDTYGDGDSNLPNNNWWQGIYFYNEAIDANCILENCTFKNGSYWYYPYPGYEGYWPSNRGAVTLNNASPTIKSCLFEANYFGIISFNTSLPTITNCDFVGTDPTYGYGVWNQTSTNTVTAENCWWNHNTGPKNATNNPGGLGERVSNYVDFTPWATQLAKPVLGDVSMNGEVKPYDASLVLQHSVAVIILTDKQKGVADVSGNGIISSYDASLILQYSVGLISRFDPEPEGTKSAFSNGFVAVSFPALISEPNKKTFEIPVKVSTGAGIKAVDMKYAINRNHIKFLQVKKDNFPADINILAGFNSQTGEVIVAMASAYDLNLNDQEIMLEFEFVGAELAESQFNLATLMANDDIMTDVGTATIISKSTVTGIGDPSQLSEPIVYTGNEGIHARFNLTEAGSDLDIRLVDMAGRTLYRKMVKNMVPGMQYIDLSYSDFDKPGRGICILHLNAGNFSYSKKVLIK